MKCATSPRRPCLTFYRRSTQMWPSSPVLPNASRRMCWPYPGTVSSTFTPRFCLSCAGHFPLFWTFRLGREETGVTVHFMDAGLDTGDIVMQQKLRLPDGITGPEADALLAGQGAALLLDACRELDKGTLPRRPQTGEGSSCPRPSAADFHIPTSWPARRAYNFIRGTAEWRTPYLARGPGIKHTLRQALGFDETAVQEKPLLQNGRDYYIQFNPGVLHAQ